MGGDDYVLDGIGQLEMPPFFLGGHPVFLSVRNGQRVGVPVNMAIKQLIR